MTKVMTNTTMRIARCVLRAVSGAVFITACDTTGSMKGSSGSKGEAGWKVME